MRESLAAAEPKNDQARLDVGSSLERVATQLYYTGELPGALESYRKALATTEPVFRASPANLKAGLQLVRIHNEIGDLAGNRYVINLGRTDEAAKHYQEALRVIHELSDRDPKNPELLEGLADCYLKVGAISENSDLTASLDNYEAAVAIAQSMAAADSNNARILRLVESSDISLGDTFVKLRDEKRAMEPFREAVAIAEKLHAADPRNSQSSRDLVKSYLRAGDTLVGGPPFLVFPAKGGRPIVSEDGLQALRKAVAVAEAMVAGDPGSADSRRALYLSHQHLGIAWVKAGRLADALQTFRTALTIHEAEVRAAPQNAQNRREMSFALEAVGRILAEMGNPASGLASVRSALVIREEWAKANPNDLIGKDDVAVVCRHLGAIEVQMAQIALRPAALGHWREARALYQRALEISEEIRRMHPAFKPYAGGADDPDALAREIARCDAAIASLTDSRASVAQR